ncbi:unnamed protein product [Rangifer tarandus platyrhynchus]|uniref:Uncharacterized protein n=2 Tax=Rangifer tarandus platyrhynchus TaxID=3082113 RepID=A0AC59Y4J6_RANTA|nr:unnamed protein product [Rangifer tarandus platyrhynchus]
MLTIHAWICKLYIAFSTLTSSVFDSKVHVFSFVSLAPHTRAARREHLTHVVNAVPSSNTSVLTFRVEVPEQICRDIDEGSSLLARRSAWSWKAWSSSSALPGPQCPRSQAPSVRAPAAGPSRL